MVAFSTPAFAEDVVAYQTEGDAPASGVDPRTMALDEAFANAVTTALSELVEPATRTARKGELDREIVGRARLWVVKFSVTKDETVEDRREIMVSVRIDRDKLRARLGELNIPTKDTALPASGAGEPASTAPAAKTITVLLRVTTPDGVEATYGAGGTSDVQPAGSLYNVIRSRGFAVRKAPTTGPAARSDGELPLSDDEADALAAGAKADLMAVASVSVGTPVPVRGRMGTAALVTARVRLVDRKDHKVVGEGMATAAGMDDKYALGTALLLASSDILPPLPVKLGAAGAFKGDDTPISEAGIVLVRMPSRTSLSQVVLEQKFLAGAKGVRGASLRRLSPSGWVIGVATNESVEQVARIAKKAPASNTSASVKIVDGVVEVTLSGAP
jgi:hypothetical protein